MSFRSSLAIALKALRRHKLQTALTMLGMTIGVAAVLTMIALGTGAEAAIEQQVRAAGMNLIVVTAGNYKMKTEEDFGGVVDHQARRATIEYRVVRAAFHPENDPMEKHDHPTARQRLGDSEAGLGSAATLTSADAEAVRAIRGVQYVAEGLHQNVHVKAGDRRWFTRLHGTDMRLPLIRRAWTFRSGRFFSAGEQSKAEQVMVLGSVAAQRVFGDENPVGRDVAIWNQSFRVVGVVTTTSWMVAAEGLSRYLHWSATISPSAVLLAVGVAAAVGIFFGWYPAKQAAGLDPIQSLRYE
jgi:ABC-type lipoprotein release transport system permease subunit